MRSALGGCGCAAGVGAVGVEPAHSVSSYFFTAVLLLEARGVERAEDGEGAALHLEEDEREDLPPRVISGDLG